MEVIIQPDAERAALVTASALQFHPDCKVIVDEASAALLQGTEYYRWIYANEPDWVALRELLDKRED